MFLQKCSLQEQKFQQKFHCLQCWYKELSFRPSSLTTCDFFMREGLNLSEKITHADIFKHDDADGVYCACILRSFVYLCRTSSFYFHVTAFSAPQVLTQRQQTACV